MIALVTLVRTPPDSGGGAFEGVIVAVTSVFSITVLRHAWTRRAELLAGDPAGPRDSGTPAPAP